MGNKRQMLVRALAVLVVSLGLMYVWWRWSSTISWSAWWIAIPLIVAETYSLGESVLYSLTMWNARRRPPPPPAPPGRTVDVFITTYNEPLDLVLKTAIAARDIDYPHQTWILDDGQRPEFEHAAAAIGVGYLTRGPEWEGRQRFAKAGNINNALFKTTGEFIAILDADQVPEPRFLDRVLGYFDDETVAFVQTPQQFWNVPGTDPLGSQAELFYGPIQQGKDGWGAAFFCGSNAVLRREALMALGLTRFSRDAIGRARIAIRGGRSRLQELLSELAVRDPSSMPAVESALAAVSAAEGQLRRGEVLTEISYELRGRFSGAMLDHPELPAEVIGELDAVLELIEVARTDQALAVHPMDTSSITEDMATAMHLHAMGWASVYHHETLVHGLAPEDLGTMLSQRRRWAAGTMQVFFSNNPLLVRGLTPAQRLMYLGTMTSYLNGFAAVIYIAAPIIFLTVGVFPMSAEPEVFFANFVPFFLACQLLFLVAGQGSRGLWRGQQMSFALFPTWIGATVAGAAAGLFGRHLTFSVTAKTKQSGGGPEYRYVRPQLLAMVLLTVASAIGVARMINGDSPVLATALTLIWVAIDLALLAVVIPAARYQGAGVEIQDPCPATAELQSVLRSVAVTEPASGVSVSSDARANLSN